MSIENFKNLSHDERARTFTELSPDERFEYVKEELPGTVSIMRSRMSSDQVSGHIDTFKKHATIGPFGERLPDTCTEDSSKGFGTYAPNREECIDCPVSILCFCRSTGRYYEEMRVGVDTEREMKEDQLVRRAKMIVGQSSKSLNTFDYLGKTYLPSNGIAYDMSRCLDENGSLNIAEYSRQVTGGVKGTFRFHKCTGTGDYLIRWPIPLEMSDYPKGVPGIQYRFADINGQENKMRMRDFVEHCKKNGDTDRQILFAIFYGYYGVYRPNGWCYRFNKKIAEGPDYIWSEYIVPRISGVARDMCDLSRGLL